LENGRSEDDKMSRRMWEAVETKAGKTRVVKRKRTREKRKRRKETREEETKERRRKEEKEKEKTIEVKKVAEKWEIWEIWDEEKEIAKLEEEVKRLVLEKFYKWIHVFGKKPSKRILVRKV